MSERDPQAPLEAEALREIERSLHGKLRARRFSDSFIERCGEEALQRGYVEYLRAVRKGVRVENRDAFIVDQAYKRAIDELRREERLADGAAVEAILEGSSLAEAPTEDVAIEALAAQEVREAIEALSAEERQVLALHYFERLSSRRGAEILYCSERTFRRRLRQAIAHVRRQLGVPAPRPGSGLAVAVGQIAHASLRGGRVPLSQGPLAPARNAIDRAREAAGQLAGRLGSSGGAGEKIGALAGTPAAKIAGCAGAAVACALGGVLGAGVGQGTAGHPVQSRAGLTHVSTAPASVTGPAPSERSAATTEAGDVEGAEAQKGGGGASATQRRTARSRAERRRVRDQTSGIARAGEEPASVPSSGAEAAAAEEPAPVSVTPAPASPEGQASEEEQAKRQFARPFN